MKMLLSCLFVVLVIGNSAAWFGPIDPNATLVPNVSVCKSLCIYGGECPWGAYEFIPGYDCNPGYCRLKKGGFCLPLLPTTPAPETTTAASTETTTG